MHASEARAAAVWLPHESQPTTTNRENPSPPPRASLRGHCRDARWLIISAHALEVRVPPLARTSCSRLRRRIPRDPRSMATLLPRLGRRQPRGIAGAWGSGHHDGSSCSSAVRPSPDASVPDARPHARRHHGRLPRSSGQRCSSRPWTEACRRETDRHRRARE